MIKFKKKLPLFWYSINSHQKYPSFLSKKFVVKLLGLEKENYGDLLSKYLVEKITKNRTFHYKPTSGLKFKNFFVIGSILNYCDNLSIVWGSGIIDKSHSVEKADFRAVRGPLTRKRLLELGHECPEIYGDPALLLPNYYFPKIQKKYKIGIIPHFYDYGIAKLLFDEIPGVKIVNLLTNSIENTTDEILSCNLIISSSLHGIIVPHAYGIPAIWVKFSNNLSGDDVKFEDYLLSVDLKPYNGMMLSNSVKIEDIFEHIKLLNNLPSRDKIIDLNANLLKTCPFK